MAWTLGAPLLAATVVNFVVVSVLWLALWTLSWAEVSITAAEVAVLSGILVISALVWWLCLVNRKGHLPEDVYTYSRFSLLTSLAGGAITLALDLFLVFYDPGETTTLALTTSLSAVLTPAVLFSNPLLVRTLFASSRQS